MVTQMFKSFVGKTIKAVDSRCVNYVMFHFTDGSKQGVFAECGSSQSSIPYFEFEDTDSEDENQDEIATIGQSQSPSVG